VTPALILVSTLCRGQAGRAELFGAIQDPDGHAVAGAKVAAEDQATMIRYDTFQTAAANITSAGNPRDFEFVAKVHF
jgi:hypothetical protein